MLKRTHRKSLLAALIALSSGLLTVAPSFAQTPATPEAPATPGAHSTPAAPAESQQQDEWISPDEAIQKAEVEINRKRFPDAKLILKKAINVNPKNASLYMELYSACIKSNDWSDAVSSLEKAMEIEPAREKDVYVDYGKALFQLHRYDKAKLAFARALSFGKNKDEIHKTLIQMALREKDEPEAIAEYKEYLKVKPGDGDMHWEFANFLYKGGKGLKESLPEYKAASDCRPNDSRGHEHYAYLLLCDKDFEGSINAYTKAIKVCPNPGEVSRLNAALKYAKQQQKLAGGQPK
jgi:tetratricopeptide (TPR) repeat protein